MADNSSKFNSTVESLFSGMDSFVSAKTVVGDAVTVNDTIIVPLVDVSFGVGAGASRNGGKDGGAGGLSGKITPKKRGFYARTISAFSRTNCSTFAPTTLRSRALANSVS